MAELPAPEKRTILHPIKDKITTTMIRPNLQNSEQASTPPAFRGNITPNTSTPPKIPPPAAQVTPAMLSTPPYVAALLRRLSAAESRILELETERSTFLRRERRMLEQSKSNVPINEMVSLKMELADRRAMDDWSKLQTKYIHDTIDGLLLDYRRRRQEKQRRQRQRQRRGVEECEEDDARTETTLSHVRDMLTKILHSEQVNPHLVSTPKMTTNDQKSGIARAAFSLPDFGLLRNNKTAKSGSGDVNDRQEPQPMGAASSSSLTLTRPQRGSNRATKGFMNRSYSTSQVPSRRRRDATSDAIRDGSGNASWGDLKGRTANGDKLKLEADIRSQFVEFNAGRRLSVTREDSNEEFETVRNSLTRRSGMALRHANAQAVMMSVGVAQM